MNKRRLRDDAATPGRHQLGGGSEAAIPIKPAAKGGPLELAGHVGDVFRGHPVGQRCWLDSCVEESRALRKDAREMQHRVLIGIGKRVGEIPER